jgi:threonine dehydratase
MSSRIELLKLRDVYEARSCIASIARRTPLVPSSALAGITGGSVRLKLENLQETGSFKLRGAANKLRHLSSEQQSRGVMAVSTGNHGRALSYVAQSMDIPAVVCLSKAVPDNKVQAIQELGTEIVVAGDTYDEADAHASRLLEERGLTMVPPFDDPFIIAGQGTIGLEILEEMPEVDMVLVPLSGGGLISGIALTLKTADPEIKVIGVSMERGPAMVESLRAGRIVEIIEEPTLADALAGGIGKDNKYTFNMVRKYVDDTVLVSEDAIARAMIFALDQLNLVIEGGAAVGIAALLEGQINNPGRNIAIVISGGNVDLRVLLKLAYEADPI